MKRNTQKVIAGTKKTAATKRGAVASTAKKRGRPRKVVEDVKPVKTTAKKSVENPAAAQKATAKPFFESFTKTRKAYKDLRARVRAQRLAEHKAKIAAELAAARAEHKARFEDNGFVDGVLTINKMDGAVEMLKAIALQVEIKQDLAAIDGAVSILTRAKLNKAAELPIEDDDRALWMDERIIAKKGAVVEALTRLVLKVKERA